MQSSAGICAGVTAAVRKSCPTWIGGALELSILVLIISAPTTLLWFTHWDRTYTWCYQWIHCLLSTTLRTPLRLHLSEQTVSLQMQTQSFPCRMQYTHGDSTTTCCNGRAFFLVCGVHGWTGAWSKVHSSTVTNAVNVFQFTWSH